MTKPIFQLGSLASGLLELNPCDDGKVELSLTSPDDHTVGLTLPPEDMASTLAEMMSTLTFWHVTGMAAIAQKPAERSGS